MEVEHRRLEQEKFTYQEHIMVWGYFRAALEPSQKGMGRTALAILRYQAS